MFVSSVLDTTAIDETSEKTSKRRQPSNCRKSTTQRKSFSKHVIYNNNTLCKNIKREGYGIAHPIALSRIYWLFTFCLHQVPEAEPAMMPVRRWQQLHRHLSVLSLPELPATA